MYNIHPTDFLIFSFDREAFQSKVLFQRPQHCFKPFFFMSLCVFYTRRNIRFRYMK